MELHFEFWWSVSYPWNHCSGSLMLNLIAKSTIFICFSFETDFLPTPSALATLLVLWNLSTNFFRYFRQIVKSCILGKSSIENPIDLMKVKQELRTIFVNNNTGSIEISLLCLHVFSVSSCLADADDIPLYLFKFFFEFQYFWVWCKSSRIVCAICSSRCLWWPGITRVFFAPSVRCLI